MEVKFTPGPWGIDAGFDGSGDFNQYWQVHDGSDAIVCSTMFCMAGNKEANAHLIAAAPDLYVALIDLLKALSESGVEWDCMSSPTPLINLLNTAEEDAIVSAARTALAKARGETPET